MSETAAPNSSPAHRYARTSFWLETCGEDLAPRPPLNGDTTVDVAILGAGFSGLWTAYFLLRDNPGIEVAIVDREICGFGASGRNGGWCSPRFPVDAHALMQRFGNHKARETIIALEEIVRDIGRICEREGIDAHYRHTGLLSIARSEQQMGGLIETYRAYEILGLSDSQHLLDAEETYARVHATNIAGALRSDSGAAVHPARLVRGLARTVERLGGVIFEGTAATNTRLGRDAAIVTERGVVRARKAIVAAGEAYLPGLPQFHRSLAPMSSLIVLTEPLSASQWREVGWADGACLSSQVHTKNYLTRTQDGRILYGSRGAPYQYGSRTPEAALRHEPTFAGMREAVREWWPSLGDVEFTHAWGGYLGVPRDWLPTVNYDPTTRLAQLHGYTGRGVSTSALCAKLLAGRIGSRHTGLEDLPIHRPSPPLWEPEPFRWAGVRYVQNAFARIDKAEKDGRPRPWDAGFAEQLSHQ